MPAEPDILLIARALKDNTEQRLAGLERLIEDQGRVIRALELTAARAEGASLARLLPWIALGVSAVGLGANLLR